MDKLRLLGLCSRRHLQICRISTVCSNRYYSSDSTSNDTIFEGISRAGHRSNSMKPILDQWLKEGRVVNYADLQLILKQLRKYNRFDHALQVSEWMNDHMNHMLRIGDLAIRLSLISKVHGLEQAESYFDGLPDSSRDFKIYCSLLNCYAAHKSLEKAEQVMQKLRELRGLKSSVPYNVMLKLYFDLGEFEKFDLLVKEMEQSGIAHDKITFNTRLNACGLTADIEGMEKLLSDMACDPHFTMDWSVYVVAANGYMKSGYIEKGLAMLKKAERTVPYKSKQLAYEMILTSYATAGDKEGVYRMWNLYKDLGKVYNSSFLSMISSLMKLDDVDGAERIFKEWECTYEVLDARVLNLMIRAYCKKGLVEKAEACVKKFIDSGKEINSKTWECLAAGYCENNQMGKSVDTMKKALLASRPGWSPNQSTLAACLDYLKILGDVGRADELMKILDERGYTAGFFDKVVDDIE